MFTPGQYRKKAVEYAKLLETASGPNERREFHELQQNFTVLANNEQWLADNHEKTVGSTVLGRADGATLHRKRTKSCAGSVQR